MIVHLPPLKKNPTLPLNGVYLYKVQQDDPIRKAVSYFIFRQINFSVLKKITFDDLCMHYYEVVIVQCTLDGSAIQTFLSWRGGKPAGTLIRKKKAGIPMQIPSNFT